MRRRPPLFALMLAAFVTVIVLGFCGMGTVFVLSSGITQRVAGGGFEYPHAVGTVISVNPPDLAGDPGVINIQPPATSFPQYGGPTRWVPDWRGPVSALLAFAAVLLGAATFFSNRVSRPLTRLT